MSRYIIAMEQRSLGRNYQPLTDQLRTWGAGQLQIGVWLTEHPGTAANIRRSLGALMHPDDTVCVIQLPDGRAEWATHSAIQAGSDWLRARYGG